MSAFSLIQRPLSEIKSVLQEHRAELKDTPFNDTYIIKFFPDAKVNDPMINSLKGLIFNHTTGQIYSMTYPVPLEVKDLPLTEQQQLMSQLDHSHCVVQEALDGTLFRYAYIEGQWVLSTNNKVDANRAFWMNGISLADQFHSVKDVKLDTTQFNQDYVYLFVMCHPLNVIVVNHEDARIYHVTTYDRTTRLEVDSDLSDARVTATTSGGRPDTFPGARTNAFIVQLRDSVSRSHAGGSRPGDGCLSPLSM